MHLPWRSVAITPDGPPVLTSVDPAEAAELARLAGGRRVLEIGSAHGYSAIVMALAGAGHVTAVDNHSGATWLGDTRAIMESNLNAYGVAGQVTIVAADSRDALAGLAEQGQRFGLVFIDGDHSRAGLLADIDGVLPLLGEGAVLTIHDYTESCCCPEVGPAADDALRRPGRVTGTLWAKQF
jgi:predicted O-methyltransferase YrrM